MGHLEHTQNYDRWGQLAGSEDSQSGQIWAGRELASLQGAGSLSWLDHPLKPRLHVRQSRLGLGPGCRGSSPKFSSIVAGASFKLSGVVPSLAGQTDSKVAILIRDIILGRRLWAQLLAVWLTESCVIVTNGLVGWLSQVRTPRAFLRSFLRVSVV